MGLCEKGEQVRKPVKHTPVYLSMSVLTAARWRKTARPVRHSYWTRRAPHSLGLARLESPVSLVGMGEGWERGIVDL